MNNNIVSNFLLLKICTSFFSLITALYFQNIPYLSVVFLENLQIIVMSFELWLHDTS